MRVNYFQIISHHFYIVFIYNRNTNGQEDSIEYSTSGNANSYTALPCCYGHTEARTV